jgi:hypothetical protein
LSLSVSAMSSAKLSEKIQRAAPLARVAGLDSHRAARSIADDAYAPSSGE